MSAWGEVMGIKRLRFEIRIAERNPFAAAKFFCGV
jgi:hypothetical protein